MKIDQIYDFERNVDQGLSCLRSLYGKLFGHNINMKKGSEMKKW
jgi:hypothetical protein